MNNFFMSLCEVCQHNKKIKKANHYPCGEKECFDRPKFPKLSDFINKEDEDRITLWTV